MNDEDSDEWMEDTGEAADQQQGQQGRAAREGSQSSKLNRRPAGFWAVYNDWSRNFVDSRSRRPTTLEVETWYSENAEKVWPDAGTRPSLSDTRVHGKSLRSTEAVKQYFRLYRSRSKGTPAGPSGPAGAGAQTKRKPSSGSCLTLVLPSTADHHDSTTAARASRQMSTDSTEPSAGDLSQKRHLTGQDCASGSGGSGGLAALAGRAGSLVPRSAFSGPSADAVCRPPLPAPLATCGGTPTTATSPPAAGPFDFGVCPHVVTTFAGGASASQPYPSPTPGSTNPGAERPWLDPAPSSNPSGSLPWLDSAAALAGTPSWSRLLSMLSVKEQAPGLPGSASLPAGVGAAMGETGSGQVAGGDSLLLRGVGSDSGLRAGRSCAALGSRPNALNTSSANLGEWFSGIRSTSFPACSSSCDPSCGPLLSSNPQQDQLPGQQGQQGGHKQGAGSAQHQPWMPVIPASSVNGLFPTNDAAVLRGIMGELLPSSYTDSSSCGRRGALTGGPESHLPHVSSQGLLLPPPAEEGEGWAAEGWAGAGVKAEVAVPPAHAWQMSLQGPMQGGSSQSPQQQQAWGPPHGPRAKSFTALQSPGVTGGLQMRAIGAGGLSHASPTAFVGGGVAGSPAGVLQHGSPRVTGVSPVQHCSPFRTSSLNSPAGLRIHSSPVGLTYHGSGAIGVGQPATQRLNSSPLSPALGCHGSAGKVPSPAVAQPEHGSPRSLACSSEGVRGQQQHGALSSLGGTRPEAEPLGPYVTLGGGPWQGAAGGEFGSQGLGQPQGAVGAVVKVEGQQQQQQRDSINQMTCDSEPLPRPTSSNKPLRLGVPCHPGGDPSRLSGTSGPLASQADGTQDDTLFDVDSFWGPEGMGLPSPSWQPGRSLSMLPGVRAGMLADGEAGAGGGLAARHGLVLRAHGAGPEGNVEAGRPPCDRILSAGPHPSGNSVGTKRKLEALNTLCVSTASGAPGTTTTATPGYVTGTSLNQGGTKGWAPAAAGGAAWCLEGMEEEEGLMAGQPRQRSATGGHMPGHMARSGALSHEDQSGCTLSRHSLPDMQPAPDQMSVSSGSPAAASSG